MEEDNVNKPVDDTSEEEVSIIPNYETQTENVAQVTENVAQENEKVPEVDEIFFEVGENVSEIDEKVSKVDEKVIAEEEKVLDRDEKISEVEETLAPVDPPTTEIYSNLINQQKVLVVSLPKMNLPAENFSSPVSSVEVGGVRFNQDGSVSKKRGRKPNQATEPENPEVKIPKKRGRKPKPRPPVDPNAPPPTPKVDEVRYNRDGSIAKKRGRKPNKEKKTIGFQKLGYIIISDDDDEDSTKPESVDEGEHDATDNAETLDPEKAKEKQRLLAYKMKSLKCTLNHPFASGKRVKKSIERLEIVPTDKRKSLIEGLEGNGVHLGNITYINTKLMSAGLRPLRLLHRAIYRKQGAHSEKIIRKVVVKFNGFPFDGTHPEIKKRREVLQKTESSMLGQLCDILALKRGNKEVMIDRIIGFLLCPNHQSVTDYINETIAEKQAGKSVYLPNTHQSLLNQELLYQFPARANNKTFVKRMNNFTHGDVIEVNTSMDTELEGTWEKPPYFSEGNGFKLKYIRAISSSLKPASDNFIELLHRLMFMNVDEPLGMRRNILEFSGLKCEANSTEYIDRMKILSVLSSDQLKLFCKVLCLPTWHRRRQLMAESIMDFISAPRISIMKKRMPPHFSDEITFSFDSAKLPVKPIIPELKSVESEEIEIIPDIHIPDDEGSLNPESGLGEENEYLGVKLKNFSNIHNQVINTRADKLNAIHRILYKCFAAQHNVRRNILEFSGFSFDELSPEYKSRRDICEILSIEDLKIAASVLCVSQYIADESREKLIDGILKFLLKPSALLNSSTIMPNISPGPGLSISPVVRKKATSTSISSSGNEGVPNIVISEVKSIKEMPINVASNPISSSITSIHDAITASVTPVLEKIKTSLYHLPNDLQITPLPPASINTTPVIPMQLTPATVNSTPAKRKEKPLDADAPLAKILKTLPTAPVRASYFDSDDDDDTPLSKMVGHPNDENNSITSQGIKHSLEDLTNNISSGITSESIQHTSESLTSITSNSITSQGIQNTSEDLTSNTSNSTTVQNVPNTSEDIISNTSNIRTALGIQKTSEGPTSNTSNCRTAQGIQKISEGPTSNISDSITSQGIQHTSEFPTSNISDSITSQGIQHTSEVSSSNTFDCTTLQGNQNTSDGFTINTSDNIVSQGIQNISEGFISNMCDNLTSQDIHHISKGFSSSSNSLQSTSRTSQELPQKIMRVQVHPTNVSNEKQATRKCGRNLGTEYKSHKSGKIRPPRCLGPACGCKLKCRISTGPHADDIFNNFWDLGDFNAQNAYIFSMITLELPKRRYPKKTKKKVSSRNVSVKYHLDIQGKDLEVCKTEFLSIHGLQNSRGRVNNIVNILKSGSSSMPSDRRGTHRNRPKQVSKEKVKGSQEKMIRNKPSITTAELKIPEAVPLTEFPDSWPTSVMGSWSNPIMNPWSIPVTNPWSNPVTDSWSSSVTCPWSNPVTGPWTNPLIDALSNSEMDPQTNPVMNTQSNPIMDTQSNPVMDTQSNPIMVTQSNSETNPPPK